MEDGEDEDEEKFMVVRSLLGGCYENFVTLEVERMKMRGRREWREERREFYEKIEK